jgi:hypothetical protein
MNIGPVAVNFLQTDFEQLLWTNDDDRLRLLDWRISVNDIPNDTGIAVIAAAPIAAICAYSTDDENTIQLLQPTLGGNPRLTMIRAPAGSLDFAQAWEISIEASRIIVGDILRNGRTEIVAASGDKLSLIDETGLISWTREHAGIGGKTALGDINSDGFPEIVIVGDSKILAFNRNGTLMDDFPVDLNRYDLGGVIEGSPILADIDNDDNPDIVVGLPGGSVYSVDFRGDRLSGFPLPSSFGIGSSPAIGDFNHNGMVDIVAVEKSGAAKAWDLGVGYDSLNAPWPVSGGDRLNSGYLGRSFQKPILTTDEQLPENSVYCYPNPATGSTTVRYYLNSDSDVRIDIFDFMGDRIHSARVAGQAHSDNEYVWHCADVASGIYYCRIEAAGDSGETWRMIKIAVVN